MVFLRKDDMAGSKGRKNRKIKAARGGRHFAPSQTGSKNPGDKGTDKKSVKKGGKTMTGTFELTKKGFGFVIPDKSTDDRDIFISSRDTLSAWNKDRVECSLLPSRNGKRPEGVITGILERNTESLVGIFDKRNGFGFVIPEDRRIIRDLYIAGGDINGAKNGDYVVVRITDYGGDGRNPAGKITEILGGRDEAGADIFAIARSMELPMEFGVKQQNQADRCPNHVIANDFSGREDLRSWQLVTIDGPDAKDLDDAVSLTELKDGTYELGVHIADVSNYVQEGSALDKEALKRGTSVYLADRVIPMLPERLSNGICSLNAGEDRLALSCIMHLGKRGKILSHRIAETVINVGERMSYPDVRAILEEDAPGLKERYRDYLPLFQRMLKVSKLIRGRRRRRGAVDFDFPEAKIRLDAAGIPTDIVAEEPNCATQMIEDFMLSANETVAEDFRKRKIPFVYRVHQEPDPDKIEKLIAFAHLKDVKIEKKKQKITPGEIQAALRSIEGKPIAPLLSRLAIRSMTQARYETECIGHFGLAARYYCHFTSPIRRYPDLQIHRIIRETLRGRMNEMRIAHYKEILDDVAFRSSLTERRADEAERETEKLKKAQYLGMHIGEEFAGVISSITGWGMYVELENTAEGLVSAASMTDDYYEFDEDNYSMVGRLSRRTYTIGDQVRIKVRSVDLLERTVDFDLCDNPSQEHP